METNDLASLGLAFTIFALLFILVIALYLISSYALYKVGLNRGHKESWVAFIPIVNSFYIPYLVKDQVNEVFKDKFLVIYVSLFLLSAVPVIGVAFALASAVLSIYALLILFRDYSVHYKAYLVLTILTFGIGQMIALLRFMNREPAFINKRTEEQMVS